MKTKAKCEGREYVGFLAAPEVVRRARAVARQRAESLSSVLREMLRIGCDEVERRDGR